MATSKGKGQVLVTKHPEGGWGVKQEGADRFSVKTDTQAEAIDKGKQIATNQGKDLTVFGKDGKIVSKDSYGKDPNPPKDKEH